MIAATRRGASRWTAWPAPRTTSSVASGIADAHLRRDRLELRVALADHQRHRHRQLAQPVPDRWERPGAQTAERACEPGGSVPQPIAARRLRARCPAGRPTRASRPSAPRTLRCSSARARPATRSSASPTRLALRRIRESRAAADQHQPLDALRRPEREVQRQPAAHRVPDERERPRVEVAQVGDRGLERDRLARRRRAVATDIGRERPIAFAELRQRTGSQLAPVCVKPWSSTSVGKPAS